MTLFCLLILTGIKCARFDLLRIRESPALQYCEETAKQPGQSTPYTQSDQKIKRSEICSTRTPAQR